MRADERWRRWAAPYLPTLRATLLLALGCNAGLELFRLLGVEGHLWRFKTPWFPLLFAVSTLVVWLVVGLVHAVVGRLWLTRLVMVAATVTIALVDYEKVRLRREPLYPSDLAFLTQLDLIWGMVGLRSLLLTLLGAAFLMVVMAAWRRFTTRRPAKTVSLTTPAHPAVTALLRALTAAACLLALVQVAHFNHPGNPGRALYDAAGAQWRPWSQQRNYLGNGFVAGVLYNTDVPAMPEPPGYGRAAMAEVAERYAAEAARINAHRTAGALDGVNVVMVLSESLSDPTVLRGVHPAEDPIPFTRELMRTSTSGRMLAASIGGGTANMEFETLTGMSLAQFPAQLRVPFQMLVPDRGHFPSFVQWYEQQGHRPVAVHPFTTEMYRRRDVYRAFGFDEFVHEDRMTGSRRLGHDGYVSDASAFDEVVNQLQEAADPLLVNLVTMQNHIPYGDRYDDPVAVTGPDGEDMAEIGQYLRGLAHSDAALRGFVAALEELREPTVLLVYGDHLPGTYPAAVHGLNGDFAMRQTPFLVWSTFDAAPVRPPLMSPTHFTDVLLEHADAPVSPYVALLTRLRGQVPALDGRRLYDADGRPVPLDELGATAQQLLRDYRLVQYDLAVGAGWSEDAMLSTVPSSGATTSALGSGPCPSSSRPLSAPCTASPSTGR